MVVLSSRKMFTFWKMYPPGFPHPATGSVEGTAFTLGWLLIVRMPCLLTCASLSTNCNVSGASSSWFHGSSFTLKETDTKNVLRDPCEQDNLFSRERILSNYCHYVGHSNTVYILEHKYIKMSANRAENIFIHANIITITIIDRSWSKYRDLSVTCRSLFGS